MADIFREVEEDVRRDRMAALWKRHSRHLYAGAALIVAATAGYVFWDEHRQHQNEALGQRYAEAEIAAQADPAKAVSALEALAADADGSGYAILARLQAAVLKAKGSDRAGGAAALKAIAADSNVGQPYRDLALLLSVSLGADDEPPADLIQRLKPLTDAANPWRFSALELSALAQLKSGDKATALKSYQQLSDDLAAPPSVRARAAEIAAALSH